MKNLKTLLESDVLTDETKQVLQEAWDTALAAKESEIEVRYAEKLNESYTEMNTLVTSLIEEAVADEMASIADELVEARTLEVRYAKRLDEFKEEYAQKSDEMMKELVKESVDEEMDELKEDIEYAKKIGFAMKMFEAFQSVYTDTFGGEEFTAKEQLEEAHKELDQLRREKIIGDLTESLSEDGKAIANTLLENVATKNLEARFNSFLPILIKEEEETQETVVVETEEVKPEGKVVLEGEEDQQEQVSTIDPQVARMIARSLSNAKRK